jgi:hypothetical protein
MGLTPSASRRKTGSPTVTVAGPLKVCAHTSPANASNQNDFIYFD